MTIIMLLLVSVACLLFEGALMHLRFPGWLWLIIFPYLLTLVSGIVVCKKVAENPVQFVSVYLNLLSTKFFLMMGALVTTGLILRAHVEPALLTLFIAYILFALAEYIWVFRKAKKKRANTPTFPA